MYDEDFDSKESDWTIAQNSLNSLKAARAKINSFWSSSSTNSLTESTNITNTRKSYYAAVAAEKFQNSQQQQQHNHQKDLVELKGQEFKMAGITNDNISLFRDLNLLLFPVIYQETFYQNVLHRYPNCLSRLAYHKGKAVGAISCRREVVDGASRVYIMTIGVLDSYRRFGLGSVLLSRILDACEKDNTIHHICLHAHVLNSAALAFYKRNGFRVEDRIDNYYEKDVVEPPDAYFLKKA